MMNKWKVLHFLLKILNSVQILFARSTGDIGEGKGKS